MIAEEATGGVEESRLAGIAALDELIPEEYDKLRDIARRQLSFRPGEATLSPTGLVHEAYLKLAAHREGRWKERAHLVNLVGVAMRSILADRAKARHALKRDGDMLRVTLDEDQVAKDQEADVMLQLHDALEWLASVEPRLARIIDCRFFVGLNEEETAELLGLTSRTVQRDWVKARMLLRRALTS